MNFENKTVLVYGTGISGISAVSLLESVEARVILYDENTKLTKEKVKEKLAAGSKAKIILGVLSEEIIKTLGDRPDARRLRWSHTGMDVLQRSL